MIENWEHEMGESFLDYHGDDIDEKVFGGFLMAKEPSLSLDIIEIMNQPFSEVQNFEDVLYDKYMDNAWYKLLEYVVEFVNLTELTKVRVLESLKR